MDEEASKHHEERRNTLLVLLNCSLLAVGAVGGQLLSRMYFLHGGHKRWLSAFTVTAGFPILILPIAVSYKRRRFLIPARLAAASGLLGLLLGFNSYLYSFGTAYLPVSVASLVGSSQLAFTAAFAFLIVKQRFSHYTVNAVVLMTLGSAVLGFHMDGDIPKGESKGKYALGFFMTIAASATHALFMTLLQYTQGKARVPVDYDVVLQVQLVISMVATLFCAVPMIINGDFQGLQVMIIGSLGLVLCSSSLVAGIVTSLLVPVRQVSAVIFLREGFNAEKGMALTLCLWGFASHLYGRYRAGSEKQDTDDRNPQQFEHGNGNNLA
ncbi:unnamed protein product [Linum tenue]|uniref:Probable purine permease n=1 Tax=Linum tenue TaxID=586396 RepID=A0AAV0J5I3_9ROSI|nr:unnamed protein product [Linum tenue]